jgi:hypothetical protein
MNNPSRPTDERPCKNPTASAGISTVSAVSARVNDPGANMNDPSLSVFFT